MNWQKDKLTIIGFGIIFVILAVFGYLLWDINREPMAEVVTETTPPETIVPETPASEEQELPEYPITKLDTTGWEYRETKLGDVGIRYKVMKKDLDNRVGDDKFLDTHFDLEEFGVKGLIIGADNNSRLGKGYDSMTIVNCVNCGQFPYIAEPGQINVNIIESSNSNDIENIFLNQTCDYTVINTKADGGMYPFDVNKKCSTDEKFTSYNLESNKRELRQIGDIASLRFKKSSVTKYKNPFIRLDKVSQLIKYQVATGNLDGYTGDNIDNSTLQLNDQLLFIIDLGNSKFAIITQSNADFKYAPGAYKEDDATYNERANNLMHTILSTIEVL
jgi:hypothetical protein